MPRLIDADLLKLGINKNDEIFCTPVRPLIIDLIDNMLTADVQPVKHGRWINTNNPNHLRCSNCDIIHMIAQYPNGKISYCPNCGARMDGESE